MVMPLVLKGMLHEVDLLDHTRPELPEGLQCPLAILGRAIAEFGVRGGRRRILSDD